MRLFSFVTTREAFLHKIYWKKEIFHIFDVLFQQVQCSSICYNINNLVEQFVPSSKVYPDRADWGLHLSPASPSSSHGQLETYSTTGLIIKSWNPWNLSFHCILFHEWTHYLILAGSSFYQIWLGRLTRVNSHQTWKQTRNRVCFHLWCELTSAMSTVS